VHRAQRVSTCQPTAGARVCGYTAHREAKKRRQKTREWLQDRERARVAPPIVPGAPERNQRVEPERSRSYQREQRWTASARMIAYRLQEDAFGGLDRATCEAYIKSQAHEGWRLIHDHYDDGAFSGASLDRPALQKMLAEIRARKIDIVVVYKVDRLTRSLADFAKLVELFDQHAVSFVSVTQSFNTTSSMGRLTLNVLLSFAQFEREVIGERVRDKISALKRKGLWMGGRRSSCDFPALPRTRHSASPRRGSRPSRHSN
jgi:DNA invertase Pin-like site-specific DNA recombinase